MRRSLVQAKASPEGPRQPLHHLVLGQVLGNEGALDQPCQSFKLGGVLAQRRHAFLERARAHAQAVLQGVIAPAEVGFAHRQPSLAGA